MPRGEERKPGSQSGCRQEQGRGEGRGWGKRGERGGSKGKAMTIHQVKGLRMESAVTDIGSDLFALGQA
jgi:hypothetical protein